MKIVQLVLFFLFFSEIQGRHKCCKNDYKGKCKKICDFNEVAITAGGCESSQCCIQHINKTAVCINDGNTCENTCKGPVKSDTGQTCCDDKPCCCTDDSQCSCKHTCDSDEEPGKGKCCDQSKMCCVPCNKTTTCEDSNNSCSNTCSSPGQYDSGEKCCDGQTCCCTDDASCSCKLSCGANEELGPGSCCNRSLKCCLPCNKTSVCLSTGINTCTNMCNGTRQSDTGTKCCDGQTCCAIDFYCLWRGRNFILYFEGSSFGNFTINANGTQMTDEIGVPLNVIQTVGNTWIVRVQENDEYYGCFKVDYLQSNANQIVMKRADLLDYKIITGAGDHLTEEQICILCSENIYTVSFAAPGYQGIDPIQDFCKEPEICPGRPETCPDEKNLDFSLCPPME